jgi:hypothetical protein
VGPVVAVVSLWFPGPGELLSVGLTPVFPGKLDVGGEDEDGDDGGGAGRELAAAGADVLTWGLAVLAGLGPAGQEGEPVA